MQQRELRRTIPSLQRANDDEFTPDQRSVWAGNLVSCSSLATLGHSSMPGIRSAPDALVDRQRLANLSSLVRSAELPWHRSMLVWPRPAIRASKLAVSPEGHLSVRTTPELN